MNDTKVRKTTKSQLDRFKETARALGADEDEAAFEEKLKKLAKAPAQPNKRKEDSR
jgi:hypothetical protein